MPEVFGVNHHLWFETDLASGAFRARCLCGWNGSVKSTRSGTYTGIQKHARKVIELARAGRSHGKTGSHWYVPDWGATVTSRL
jgi:hypothetical protein